MAAQLPQYVAGVAAAMGAFAAGTMLGWSSPAQSDVQNGKAYGFHVSDEQYSWVGSLVTLGAASVCVPIGTLMNIIGRKPTMLLLVVPFLIGWSLLIFASNVTMLYVARFLLGVSGGAFCITAPMYTTEIATVDARGTLGSFFQLLLVCGVTFTYVIGASLPLSMVNMVCAVMPIIFAICFIWVPESPVYWISKGKPENALKSLQWLRGANYNAQGEVDEMKSADAKMKEGALSLTAAMFRKSTMKALGISMMLMVLQQLGGINAVIFYSTSIFDDANSGLSGSTATILIGVMMVISTFISVMIIDKAGRRILLLVSGLFQAISTFGLGYYFNEQEKDTPNLESITWIPITSLLIFIIMFSVGYGPVPWLLMAELFTADVKNYAGPIAGMSNWLLAFVVTKTFAPLKQAVGSGMTFWLYTAVSVFGLFFVFLFLPETKGRTTAEIQNLIAGKNADGSG